MRILSKNNVINTKLIQLLPQFQVLFGPMARRNRKTIFIWRFGCVDVNRCNSHIIALFRTSRWFVIYLKIESSLIYDNSTFSLYRIDKQTTETIFFHKFHSQKHTAYTQIYKSRKNLLIRF